MRSVIVGVAMALSLASVTTVARAEGDSAREVRSAESGARVSKERRAREWGSLPKKERVAREWRSLPRGERVAREKNGLRPEILD